MVAIKIDEMHCTMTAIRSDIMVLTVEVSFMIREVREPTLFSGLSNHANSLRSTAKPKTGFEMPENAAAQDPTPIFTNSRKLLCVPVSVTCPFCTTTIISAFTMVDILCAIKMTVLPFIALSNAESSALVASSSKRIGGFFNMALAIAILCFCPPDN
ncbi:Protein of unknown function DUF1602, partial [Cynara cardunculus var. scolymus]